jgi:hypothetical protein
VNDQSRHTRGVNFGLCDSCKHQRIVKSGRGSVFSLCELGRTDPDWPKYPRVPVAKCRRHEPAMPTTNQAGTTRHDES